MTTKQAAKEIKKICNEAGLTYPIKNIDGYSNDEVYLSDILKNANLIIKILS